MIGLKLFCLISVFSVVLGNFQDVINLCKSNQQIDPKKVCDAVNQHVLLINFYIFQIKQSDLRSLAQDLVHNCSKNIPINENEVCNLITKSGPSQRRKRQAAKDPVQLLVNNLLDTIKKTNPVQAVLNDLINKFFNDLTASLTKTVTALTPPALQGVSTFVVNSSVNLLKGALTNLGTNQFLGQLNNLTANLKNQIFSNLSSSLITNLLGGLNIGSVVPNLFG